MSETKKLGIIMLKKNIGRQANFKYISRFPPFGVTEIHNID